jgi:hypothetical protein
VTVARAGGIPGLALAVSRLAEAEAEAAAAAAPPGSISPLLGPGARRLLLPGTNIVVRLIPALGARALIGISIATLLGPTGAPFQDAAAAGAAILPLLGVRSPHHLFDSYAPNATPGVRVVRFPSLPSAGNAVLDALAERHGASAASQVAAVFDSTLASARIWLTVAPPRTIAPAFQFPRLHTTADGRVIGGLDWRAIAAWERAILSALLESKTGRVAASSLPAPPAVVRAPIHVAI